MMRKCSTPNLAPMGNLLHACLCPTRAKKAALFLKKTLAWPFADLLDESN